MSMRCEKPRVGGRIVRRGVAALEMAILLPFVFMMFAAAVDFARVYQATQTLQDCASAGAIYASGTGTSAVATGQVQAAKDAAVASGASLSPALQASDVTVVIDNTAGTAAVTVNYT